jgi:crossover junction endodeoxyribonuclease RuvC
MCALVLGIDPGLNGALALYDAGTGALTLYDMPTLELQKSSGGKRRVVDAYALANILDGLSRKKLVIFIEQSWPRPDEGPTGAFSFGMNYGVVYGACAANFFTVETVSPQRWKRAIGLTGDKDASRARASALLPQHSNLWLRKKDDGRAEASLIAIYGARTLAKEAA